MIYGVQTCISRKYPYIDKLMQSGLFELLIVITFIVGMMAFVFFVYGIYRETAKAIITVEVIAVSLFFLFSWTFGWWSVLGSDMSTYIPLMG